MVDLHAKCAQSLSDDCEKRCTGTYQYVIAFLRMPRKDTRTARCHSGDRTLQTTILPSRRAVKLLLILHLPSQKPGVFRSKTRQFAMPSASICHYAHRKTKHLYFSLGLQILLLPCSAGPRFSGKHLIASEVRRETLCSLSMMGGLSFH